MDQIPSRPCIDSKNHCLFKVKVLIGSPIYRPSIKL